MKHPYEFYAFAIAEKTSKCIEEVESMDANLFHRWIAYISLQDEEYRKKIENLNQVEKPPEQQLNDIVNLYNKTIIENGRKNNK